MITWLISCLPSLPVQFKTAPATVLFPLTISARHWWRSRIRQISIRSIWSQFDLETSEREQMQIKHIQEWVSRSTIIGKSKDYTGCGYLKSGKLHGKGWGAQDMTQWLKNIEYQQRGTCYTCFTFPLSKRPSLHSLILLLNGSEDGGRCMASEIYHPATHDWLTVVF